MSIVESRLFHEPAPVAPAAGTRLQRRALLDLSVDEEVVRGDLRGAGLDDPLKSALAVIVEHELRQEESLLEDDILDMLRSHRLASRQRYRRRLDVLAGMNLIRREGRIVHATVAGISAVLRPSTLDGPRLPRDLLRVLRQAELSRLGR